MAITMADLEKIKFPYYYNLVKEGKMKAQEVKDLLFNGNPNKYYRYVRFLEEKPTYTEAMKRSNKKQEEKKKRNKGKTPEQIKAEWKEKLKAMSDEDANKFFQKNMIRVTKDKGETVLIKRCSDCMEYKMVQKFSKCKTWDDGINGICNECVRKNNHKYRETKVQQALEDIRLIVEANPTKYDYIPGMEIFGIIYLVYNRITKRYYVGQTTVSFDIRYKDGFFKDHIDKRIDDERYNGPNELLQQDLELYGEESFEFNKLFKVASNKYELDKLEAYWIDKLEAYTKGYNRNRGNWFTNRGLEE